MRYQANGAKPERADEIQERLDDDQGRDERHDEADADLQQPIRRQLMAHGPSSSCTNAAAIVGIARKNENSAAARRSSPISMPPTIVAPERDTPGTSASVWQTPTASARPTGSALPPAPRRRGRNRSTTSITMPPTMNATAIVPKLSYKHALHEIGEQRPGDDRGHKRHETCATANCRSAPACASPVDHAGDPARYSHITARIEPN